MSEANDLTTGIINHIYRKGGYAFRAQSTGLFDAKLQGFRTAPKRGVADVLGCYRGKFLAVEVKIGKDRLSDEQAGFLSYIDHVGGLTFIAKTLSEFISWWDEKVDDHVDG